MQATRKSIISLLLIAISSIMCSAVAQGIGGGLRVGTPGVGAELGGLVTERFGIRAWVSGGSASYDQDESGIRYDGGFRLGTGFLLADWHPTTTGFRLSGGVVYNNQRFDATAQPLGGTININGTTYSAAQLGWLDAQMRFSKATPYLGVGWGLAPHARSRLYFSADLGVLYQRPSAMLTGNCGAALSATVCTQLHSDIRVEETEFRDAANELRFYPVISVGFGVRF